MFVQFSFSHQALFINIEDFVQLFHKIKNYSCVNLMYLNTDMKLMKSMITFKILKMNIILITFYTAQKHCYN